MKRPISFSFIAIFISTLFAQQQVVFPDDFTDALLNQTVTVTNILTVTNTNGVETYGGVYLSNGRLWIPTETNAPGITMFTTANATNVANQLLLQKGKNNYNYIAADGSCRTGQLVSNITGTVSKVSGKYAITPTVAPVFAGNERPTTHGDLGTYNVKVVSFNVENFGNTTATTDVQRRKIIAGMKALDADIYALMEVYGNTYLEDLANALTAAMNSPAYDYKFITNINNQVMCGFIYNSVTVVPYKEMQKNTLVPNTNTASYLPYRKIAQAFDLRSNNERFIICANHWKSKSGRDIPADQKDMKDGQSAYNPRRVQEATKTLEFINNMIAYYEDPDVLIVGDLNSYTKEDPIEVLINGGFINQLQKHSPIGYSYNFYTEGYNSAGYLDHSLATPSLDQQITKAEPFPINSDESSYMKISSTSTVDPYAKSNMYRCSDHDPIVTAIFLDSSTGIKTPDEEEEGEILFGNPRDGFLTLKGEYINKVELLDITGQLLSVYKKDAADLYFTLPLTGLPAGVYFVRINNGIGGATYKFVIS
ncbi:T9SS C-terminal target domain-containing protein [Bacteroides sp. 214]|uniref:T9SS type A sorting domain-containing protein n=1 Tax=Bacteroides sp. 214 TaxID=2302935 RepID=UPI0013D2C1CA|nr:T9SS type A sorting domain-containing protein [Bacteroides sp. 214]NDW13128.1 T9SS C-terminal target domain-containing protein [Bacteroides sp. 214]